MYTKLTVFATNTLDGLACLILTMRASKDTDKELLKMAQDKLSSKLTVATYNEYKAYIE